MTDQVNSQVPYYETPETERNLKMLRDYKTGSYTYRSLARIYKISFQRVAKIIKEYESK
jgi:Mor family transcriptional regulator